MSQVAKSWSPQEFRDLQQEIKIEVEALEGAPKDKTVHILGKAVDSSGQDNVAETKRYIWCIYALIHQMETNDMTMKQVHEIMRLATSILRLQNVPEKSQYSRYYEDLHFMQSQILRRNGEFWHSIWELSSAYPNFRYSSAKDRGYEFYVFGKHLHRVGHLASSCQFLEDSCTYDLAPGTKIKCKLMLAHSYRLRNQLDKAREVIDQTVAEMDLDDNDQAEFKWIKDRIDLTEGADIKGHIAAYQKGNRWPSKTKQLDTYLLGRAYGVEKAMIDRLTKPANIMRLKDVGGISQQTYISCLKALHEASSMEHAPDHIINQLGEAFAQSDQFLTLDRALLFKVAALRCLVKNHRYRLARILLDEYHSQSLRLSDSTTNDVLGVTEDLVGRKWTLKNSA